MSSYYRQQLEAYLKTLEVKAERVLDVGGSQLIMPKRVKSWDVKEYKILDLPQPHKVEKIPDIICDINFSCPLIKGQSFDVVFCLEVMEYVWNPSQALLNISGYMDQGSTLYITFPKFYPVHEPIEQDYLRYTLYGALKLLEHTGFKASRITPRKMMTASLGHVYSQEKMRAAKGYEGHEDIGYIIEAIKV